jgi:hypothetical protein
MAQRPDVQGNMVLTFDLLFFSSVHVFQKTSCIGIYFHPSQYLPLSLEMKWLLAWLEVLTAVLVKL